jgi:hypothetical protein
MEAARPSRRRRPRRRTVDRPVNVRLVRAASVLVVLPLLAFLFSIAPAGALPRPALEPAFDGRSAAELAAALATEYPSRVPGSSEAEGASRWYRETMASLGLSTEQDTWRERLPGLGTVELRNLVTVVPGRSPQAIVLVAHRDNAGAEQEGDNAWGTAALMELARGFAPGGASPAPKPQRTLVFVSTDGGAFGGAGAARFATVSPHAGRALAAIVLDDLDGGGRPFLAVAGRGTVSPSRALVASASARITEQAGVAPALPSPLAQLVDLALPYAAGEQGPLLARGIAAVTIGREQSGAGPGQAQGVAAAAPRLQRLGRAAEALVSSLDASARAGFGTPDSLFLGGRVASGWAARLLLVVAVCPFALGALDLLARARRRRLPLAAAFRALRSRALVWLSAVPLLWLAVPAGVLPAGASLPLPPYSPPVADRPTGGLAVLGLAFALVWLLARRRLAPAGRPATAEERLAGYTAALVWLAVLAVILAVTKPYALVFALPALYAWLWLPGRSRLPACAALYLLGVLAPLTGLLAFGDELGLGPGDTLLYLLGLVSVGYLPLSTLLLMLAWVAGGAQLGALAFGRYAPYAGGREPPPAGLLRRSALWTARRARARYTSGR